MTDAVQQSDRTAAFDRFYRDSRDRLLLQTYALTGDLGAARSAVRDAYVVAWHHWRKVSRLEDPETSVRPHAWRTALRRATVRPWHKEKGIDSDSRRTLEALSALSVTQRKALLLTQLASVSMSDMALEIGLPADQAERELQTAASQFATRRDVSTASIPVVFAGLARTTSGGTWPRVTIVRRAGAARRRVHTALGAVAVVAALVATGIAVRDAGGVRPTLNREPQPSPTAGSVVAGPDVSLPDTSLLSIEEVRATLDGPWQQGATHDNSVGSGLVLPCQPEGQRYADPQGAAAWVRQFRNGRPQQATRWLTEFSEASTSTRRAHRAFTKVRGWIAGCTTPGVRLETTETVPQVGDESALLMLHALSPEFVTYVVGVARTGQFTTTVSLSTDVGPGAADRDGIARLLGDAVDDLCTLPDAGRCADGTAAPKQEPVYPTGEAPGMLAALDLPFIGREDAPWVGTEPTRTAGKTTDADVLGCNSPSLAEPFDGTRPSSGKARTFVKVGESLPDAFGLTQVVGALPEKKAAALVQAYRDAVNGCPDQEGSAGTTVRLLAADDAGGSSFSAWHLSTELPGERSVEYDVAILRSDDAVSQLLFVAAGGVGMSDDQFVNLTRRALERLPRLPAYRG